MAYYPDAELERIRQMIEQDIRSGIHVISPSYVAGKYGVDLLRVQKVLSDLVSVGDLEVHYRLLCSGEKQNYDVDLEFTDRNEIPQSQITCTKCGDLYTPLEDNISVFFEPAAGYLRDLSKAS